MTRASDIVAALGLEPHPEGGHYRETFRHVPSEGTRGAMTAIYYLLAAGERSHWHRVDAAEIWHWYAGAPLALHLSPEGRGSETRRLGPSIGSDERPQIVVPAGWWQSAETLGAWTLAGCTVGPAFEFAGFQMAPKDWKPS